MPDGLSTRVVGKHMVQFISRRFTNLGSGKSPRRRKITRSAEPLPSRTGREPGTFAFRVIQPLGGTAKSKFIHVNNFFFQPIALTYSWQLDGEMREQDLLRALPLLLRGRHFVGLQFPLAEVRNGVNDNPWYAAAKVHNLQRYSTNRKSERLSLFNQPHVARNSLNRSR